MGFDRVIRRLALVAFTAGFVATACGSSSATTPTGRVLVTSSVAPSISDSTSVARTFVAAVFHGDTASAASMENETMASAAPASVLQQLAASLTSQYGSFVSLGATSSSTAGEYVNVAVTTEFANAAVTLTVSVDSGGKVAGLHVTDVKPRAAGSGTAAASGASPAAYVDPTSFSESSITVGAAPWALPGTLTMPKGSGPFPAVVLVAGSGPGDRDETYGPNKPLRDLAWGLASRGIAVLRYDKRTLVYPSQMAMDTSITVRQEVTDDAEAAIDLLRRTPNVDPARVALVGHSLGGYLAPRIAAATSPSLSGIAMLEAPSTPFARLILNQAEYLAGLQKSPRPSVQEQIARLRSAVALAESPSLSASTPASQLPLGIPASYWLDLQSYHPLTVAGDLSLPMFFSQGGRDYQVPPTELGPWQRALSGKPASFKTYGSMNHLLLDGTGTPSPTEYAIPSHVDPQLVTDLATWIGSLRVTGAGG